MRLKLKWIKIFSLGTFVLTVILIQCNTRAKTRKTPDNSGDPDAWASSIKEKAEDMMTKGKAVFRYETFGDEVFWTDQLQLHKALVSEKHGGNCKGLLPRDALAAGLKVDLKLLPEFLKQKIKEGKFLDTGTKGIILAHERRILS